MNARSTAATALLVFGVITGVLATLVIYIGDTLVDSNESAERAVAALSEPGVRDLIGEIVVDQVVSASPDALAARPLLKEVVSAAIATPAFHPIYEAAIRDLHQTLLHGELDTLTVQLTDMVLIVRTQAAVLSPELSAQIPDDLTDTLIDIQSDPTLLQAVRFSEFVRLFSLLLPLLSLAAFGGSILLSPDRRQGWVRAGLGVIAIGLVLLISETVVGTVLPLQFPEESGRVVVTAFWDAYAGDLGVWALVIAAAGAMMVAAVWWMAEPSNAAARLGQFRRFMEPPATTFPRLLWILSWILIGGFLIFNWQGAARAIATLAGAVLVTNALAELLRMVAPEQIGAAQPQVSVGRPKLRTALVGFGAGILFAAIIAGGYFAIDRSSGESLASDTFAPDFDPACNGHVLLCDRRLDDITIAATHNSMSSAEDGFLLANHSKGIIPQLDAGYRGLLIDLYYGIKSERSPVIVTDIAPPTPGEREELVAQLGAAAVRSAEELRQRNLAAGGERDIYLCHGQCEIGATLFSSELERLRGWLERNPREALVIVIQDEVTPDDLAAAFETAGLVEYVHTQEFGEPWPTLLEMIDSGRRLVVMAENDTGSIPWYHDAFTFVQETPYTFETVEEFSCEFNRGRPDSPLFMINHWVTPALAEEGAIANSAGTLQRRLDDCMESRGLIPNIIGVDFYSFGDAIETAAKLNGVPWEPADDTSPEEDAGQASQ